MPGNRSELTMSNGGWTQHNQALQAPGVASPLDVNKLKVLLRWHARLIIGIAVSILLVAGAALLIFPAKYKAVTIVLVDPRQPRVTSSEAVLSGIGSDAAAVESQVELIQSSAIAKRVIAKLGLDQDAEFSTTGLTGLLRSAAAYLIGRGANDDQD